MNLILVVVGEVKWKLNFMNFRKISQHTIIWYAKENTDLFTIKKIIFGTLFVMANIYWSTRENKF
jgi:hypothetical protein